MYTPPTFFLVFWFLPRDMYLLFLNYLIYYTNWLYDKAEMRSVYVGVVFITIRPLLKQFGWNDPFIYWVFRHEFSFFPKKR
jgi:hypothetical protein